jgi:hypothetical protein
MRWFEFNRIFDNSFLENRIFDLCYDWPLENGIWFNMMDILLENDVVYLVTWRRSERFCQMYTLENYVEENTISNKKIGQKNNKIWFL